MNYYKITDSIDLKEIGVSGQIQTVFHQLAREEQVESIYKINPQKIIDFDFNPPPFKLERMAKKTDWLNNIFLNQMITISPRFLKMLEQFSLPDHQIFPARVFHEDVEFNYFLVYFYPPMQDKFIDFEESEFVKDYFGAFKNTLEINSLEEYKVARSQIKLPEGITFSKLVFKKDIPYDIFRFFLLGRGIYISEKLKNAIQEAGLTGMEITPIEEIKHFYIPWISTC